MAEIVDQIEVWLGRSVPKSFVPDVRERTAEACWIRLNLSLPGLLPFFEVRIFSSYEVGF